MGLLDNTTPAAYYQGNNHGNYQFTSLEDIINQFLIVYVGEEKLLSKVSRTDVAFHAQRALQELSFDTFKSIKSQEITLPASNTMILPHDYVNYTRVLWSDDSGIKHPIYPTKDTQNPFAIQQDDDGVYSFGAEVSRLTNGNFTNPSSLAWTVSGASSSKSWSGIRESFGSSAVDENEFLEDGTTPNPNFGNLLQVTYPGWDVDLDDDGVINAVSYTGYNTTTGALIPADAEENLPKFFIDWIMDVVSTNGGLSFSHCWMYGASVGSNAYGAHQHVDVSDIELLDLVATATSGPRIMDGSTVICDYGEIRVGVTTTNPDIGWTLDNGHVVTINHKNPFHSNKPSPNANPDNLDLGYLEWSDGTGAEKELLDIDVSDYDDVWIYVQSYAPFTSDARTVMTQGTQGNIGIPIIPGEATYQSYQVNSVQSVFAGVEGDVNLNKKNEDGSSTTWNNYKSATPSENQDSYDDNNYANNLGERYGLDPQRAQTNGSFYIDNLRGLINFSSNISGKTVILDYISDSLGTDGEMQVHKFAEEAMYKWIMHAVLSTRANTQEYIVRRYQKEKFAATRQAKLRLSNIKLEELTQILRGKSKHIKH